MKIIRNLLLLFGLVLLVVFSCRRPLSLDELVKRPDTIPADNRPLVSGFELINTNSGANSNANNCNPCHCQVVGQGANLLQFEACDSLRATIKIKADSKDWNFQLAPGMDTFFEVKRKTGDSINYLSIMTRHLTANGQSANLDITAPDPNGKTSVIYSMILGQKKQPLICVSTTGCCNQTGSPNCATTTNCANCTTTPITTTTTTATAATATAPTYIKQANNATNGQPQTDTLVLCKGASGCGNKVYLAIETATQVTCKPCGTNGSALTTNPCNTTSTGTSSTPCNSQNQASAGQKCVERYATEESIWIASAHSTGDWLTLRVLEAKDLPGNSSLSTGIGETSVRGSKKIKYLEVQATENTTNAVRNDGIIEFRAVGGASTPVFVINVYQKN